MTSRKSPFRQYLSRSKTFHYGLILTLPALALYEIGIFLLFKDSYYELRNTGEVLLRQVFSSMGLDDIYVISAILLAIFLFIMIRGYRIEKAPGIQANYLFYMLCESLIWGALLYAIMLGYARLPLQILSFTEKMSNINLAVGAGIFEELIFRMVLISALMVVLKQGLGFGRRWVEPLGIVMAAVVFAGFHLFMEPFVFLIFMQRVIGGIYLGYIFQYRGYGISVYTHIMFNLLILAESW